MPTSIHIRRALQPSESVAATTQDPHHQARVSVLGVQRPFDVIDQEVGAPEPRKAVTTLKGRLIVRHTQGHRAWAASDRIAHDTEPETADVAHPEFGKRVSS